MILLMRSSNVIKNVLVNVPMDINAWLKWKTNINAVPNAHLVPKPLPIN